MMMMTKILREAGYAWDSHSDDGDDEDIDEGRPVMHGTILVKMMMTKILMKSGRLCMGLSAVTRVESRKWRHLWICPRPDT